MRCYFGAELEEGFDCFKADSAGGACNENVDVLESEVEGHGDRSLPSGGLLYFESWCELCCPPEYCDFNGLIRLESCPRSLQLDHTFLYRAGDAPARGRLLAVMVAPYASQVDVTRQRDMNSTFAEAILRVEGLFDMWFVRKVDMEAYGPKCSAPSSKG